MTIHDWVGGVGIATLLLFSVGAFVGLYLLYVKAIINYVKTTWLSFAATFGPMLLILLVAISIAAAYDISEQRDDAHPTCTDVKGVV